MAIIKKNLHVANAEEGMEKREPSHTINWLATIENSMEVPQRNKNKVAIWSSNPIPWHISRQNCNSKWYMYTYVHSSTIYSSQDMEMTYMSIEKWMDKKGMIYIYII